MTDKKKQKEEKAKDTPKEQKEEPLAKPQPASEGKPEEIISKEQKGEDVVDASEKGEEKPGIEKAEKPVLETPTEKEEIIGESEGKSEEEESEKQGEKVETSEIKEEKTEREESQLAEEKPIKTEPNKDLKKPPEKKDEDFQYIVRIANTDIDGEKNVAMGLAQIKGIGRHMAVLIADATRIDKKVKIGKLTDAQIEKIKEVLENIHNTAPGWMLNHRKDIDTGNDIHLISSEVDLRLRDDVNLLKMIRSYRGIRHESGLSVRGQRTRANNRKGLALGVSKKRPGT